MVVLRKFGSPIITENTAMTAIKRVRKTRGVTKDCPFCSGEWLCSSIILFLSQTQSDHL